MFVIFVVAGAADGNKKTGRSRISKPKKKDVGGFKLAGDGRLIITEDTEVKGSRKQMLSDDGGQYADYYYLPLLQFIIRVSL